MIRIQVDCKQNHCPGLIINSETLQVERCDVCARFETDEDAAFAVRSLLELVERALALLPDEATVADAYDVLDKLVSEKENAG